MSLDTTTYAQQIEFMLNNAQTLKTLKFLALKGEKFICLASSSSTSSQKSKYWRELGKKMKQTFSVSKGANIPSYRKYMRRLLKYGQFDESVYLMATIMMKDLMMHPKLEIDFTTCGLKLFATCMFLSHKYMEDVTWKMDAAAKIFGFSKEILSEMELLMIITFRYRLNIDYKDYKEIKKWLGKIDKEVKRARNCYRLANGFGHY